MTGRWATCIVCLFPARCVRTRPGYACKRCLDEATACALDRAISRWREDEDDLVGTYHREGRA